MASLASSPHRGEEKFRSAPRTGRYEVKEREAREVVLPMASAARTGTSMKRVLLSLLAIGGVFYPAFVFFAGNDANPSGDELKLAAQSASSEQATRPDITAVEQAQAAEKPDGADVMAPAVPNSRHAITVEQGLSPAPSKTQSPAPAETQSQAPAQAQPQAAAELSPAPAPQASPPKPEGGTLPSTQSTEASPDAKPSQPEFVKVTSPASVRKGPSASSAIIGIAYTSAEAQVARVTEIGCRSSTQTRRRPAGSNRASSCRRPRPRRGQLHNKRSTRLSPLLPRTPPLRPITSHPPSQSHTSMARTTGVTGGPSPRDSTLDPPGRGTAPSSNILPA